MIRYKFTSALSKSNSYHSFLYYSNFLLHLSLLSLATGQKVFQNLLCRCLTQIVPTISYWTELQLHLLYRLREERSRGFKRQFWEIYSSFWYCRNFGKFDFSNVAFIRSRLEYIINDIKQVLKCRLSVMPNATSSCSIFNWIRSLPRNWFSCQCNLVSVTSVFLSR